VCAYADGKLVVDLWGVADDAERKEEFGPDSVTMIMSASKSIAALATALMVDRGLIDYDELVFTYWPEFGKEGKALTRVKDVLRHEAGLPKLAKPFTGEDALTENIKKNAIGKHIETQRQSFPIEDGTIRTYHSVSRGFFIYRSLIVNLSRRVHPQ